MTGVAGAARLLERDGELADLVGLLARSHAGRDAAAVIDGPPGTGKTARLDALMGTPPGAASGASRTRAGAGGRHGVRCAVVRRHLGPECERRVL
ncbi:MAG: hypothetical protein WBH47_00445 [Streptosporangiaceae bacterium]